MALVVATASGQVLFTVETRQPSDACTTLFDSTCVTDGFGQDYSNNERCTVRVNEAMQLRFSHFNTEANFDTLTINGQACVATCPLAVEPFATFRLHLPHTLVANKHFLGRSSR